MKTIADEYCSLKNLVVNDRYRVGSFMLAESELRMKGFVAVVANKIAGVL